MRNDTRDIFRQLADTEGAGGVKCVIENHDAWVNSEEVQAAIGAVVRMQIARRDEARGARIEAQRRRLQALVTPVRRRVASAG